MQRKPWRNSPRGFKPESGPSPRCDRTTTTRFKLIDPHPSECDVRRILIPLKDVLGDLPLEEVELLHIHRVTVAVNGQDDG